MISRWLTFLAAFSVLSGGAAAGELEPLSGHSVRLANFNGVVYYTVEKDGFRVVATLSGGDKELAVRFVSTLLPSQRVVISVPQAVGEPSIDVEIARDGDQVVVKDSLVKSLPSLQDPAVTSAVSSK
jgi:hypothetical protein